MTTSPEFKSDIKEAGILPVTEIGYTMLCTEESLEKLVALRIEAYKKNMTAKELGSIELYQRQMAGVSTAAFGGWREGNVIDPELLTQSIIDVSRLYGKYEDLRK